jgi:hypothetical protein
MANRDFGGHFPIVPSRVIMSGASLIRALLLPKPPEEAP